jgi:hypothetical protein
MLILRSHDWSQDVKCIDPHASSKSHDLRLIVNEWIVPTQGISSWTEVTGIWRVGDKVSENVIEAAVV